MSDRSDMDAESEKSPVDGDLPVVEPPFETAESDASRESDQTLRVAGVLLAGGTSSRFGDANKLLATVEGAPLVCHAARTLVDAGLDPVVVVVGHEADQVRAAVADLPVETIENDAYESGQSTSVGAGIGAIRDRNRAVDAAIIALGDMPYVDPETIETLVGGYGEGVADALAPSYRGDRGNPVLFDRQFFEDLAAVDGDIGGREILLSSGASALVAVDDPGVRRDVDRPEDLSSTEA